MTDEQALHAAVIDRPNDKTPRLVLADYYEQNDQPEHAAVHRILAENPQSLHTAEGADKFLAEHHDHDKVGVAVSEAAHLMSRAAHKAATNTEVLSRPNHGRWDVEPSNDYAYSYSGHGADSAKKQDPQNGWIWRQHDRATNSHDHIVRGLTNRLNDGLWPEGHQAREKHRSPVMAHQEASHYNRAAATIHDAIYVKKTGYDHRNDPPEE